VARYSRHSSLTSAFTLAWKVQQELVSLKSKCVKKKKSFVGPSRLVEKQKRVKTDTTVTMERV